jgi:hypothetical protein
MGVRLRRVAARGAKRLLSVLLILAFLVETAGVAVVTRVEKDRSQPFPCQDNPCGCASAEECWHHCCCHTNREKVAWAHEHGVTPPDFVVAAAEKEGESSEHACCHRPACAKCAAKAAEGKHTELTCDVSTHHERPPAAGQPGKKGALRSVFVLTDLARRCRNLPQFWSLLGQALPVRIETAWSFDKKIVGRVFEAPVLKWRVERSAPVPPPKLGPLGG